MKGSKKKKKMLYIKILSIYYCATFIYLFKKYIFYLFVSETFKHGVMMEPGLQRWFSKIKTSLWRKTHFILERGSWASSGADGRDGGRADGSGRPALWELRASVHLQRDSAGLQHSLQTAPAGSSGLRQLLQLAEGSGQHLEGQGLVDQTGQKGRAEGLQPE